MGFPLLHSLARRESFKTEKIFFEEPVRRLKQAGAPPRLLPTHRDRESRVNQGGARSVLDCGDGVFGVAAFVRRRQAGGEYRKLERGHSQSGDFADSVTALQNLAALPECKPTTARTEL